MPLLPPDQASTHDADLRVGGLQDLLPWCGPTARVTAAYTSEEGENEASTAVSHGRKREDVDDSHVASVVEPAYPICEALDR